MPAYIELLMIYQASVLQQMRRSHLCGAFMTNIIYYEQRAGVKLTLAILPI